MRGALRLCAVGLAIVMSATAASAQVVRGNDTGGLIPWSCEREAVAQDWAAWYCARHRKFHRITSVDRQPGSYIGFSCLWHPDVARYQTPGGADPVGFSVHHARIPGWGDRIRLLTAPYCACALTVTSTCMPR